LGIWAVKETIALRNGLLVLGVFLSLCYVAGLRKSGKIKFKYSFFTITPVILIALTLFWVFVHYLLFSIDPVKQLDELKSTWLRALMALIVGFTTGLTVSKNPKQLSFLCIGILVAFFVLFYQYIPQAFIQNKLLLKDYDNYLFHLKINTTLMGMILITFIGGAFLDHIRIVNYCWKKIKPIYVLCWILGTSLVLFAFVYIVDTRNGIGLSIILYGFWLICAIFYFFSSQIRRPNLKSFFVLLISILSFCLVLYFAYMQINLNKAWTTLFEDLKVGVQIDRYTNWQNPSKMGYPKHDDGETVSPSNYERAAWATVGMRAIMDNPKGVGVLAYPLTMHPDFIEKMKLSAFSSGIATHSGWVELGLAFGIPILSLIFIALLMIIIQAIRIDYPARMTILGFVVVIFCMYSVGELAIQHGLELLYYFLAFTAALVFYKKQNFV
jgi:hypothetical protein